MAEELPFTADCISLLYIFMCTKHNTEHKINNELPFLGFQETNEPIYRLNFLIIDLIKNYFF